MTTTKTSTVMILDDTANDSVARAAAHLYDAETALHTARQTHVDSWISAAYDRLHEAVEAHRLAVVGYAA
jgi:hypothetical protein